jgi:hypothetical protein
MWEEKALAYFKALPINMSEGNEEKHEFELDGLWPKI